MVAVYTDGSAWPNPGPGGWAWWVNDHTHDHGHEPGPTTNQRMEVMAVIRALSDLPPSWDIDIVTDSAYVYDTVTKGRLADWEARGWRTQGRKPVANLDLWLTLQPLLVERAAPVTWTKVRGHQGIHGNEQADLLAGRWRDVVQ